MKAKATLLTLLALTFGCKTGEKYLIKLNPKECNSCLEAVREEVKLIKRYSAVECLFLAEGSSKAIEGLKRAGCIEYAEPDRVYRLK